MHKKKPGRKEKASGERAFLNNVFVIKALTYCPKDIIINFVVRGSGGMADAHGSGPCVGNNMRVQVPSSAR